jgi:hypothetical protein
VNPIKSAYDECPYYKNIPIQTGDSLQVSFASEHIDQWRIYKDQC